MLLTKVWTHADYERHNDDVCDEYYLCEVIPLHVIIIIRRNDKFGHFLFHSKLFILCMFVFLVFIHLFDIINTNFAHHSDNFFLLPNQTPMVLCCGDFFLFFTFVLHKFLQEVLSFHLLFFLRIISQLLNIGTPLTQFFTIIIISRYTIFERLFYLIAE